MREQVLAGPHGDLTVRVYGVDMPTTPLAGESAPRPALVWAHGGAFAAGDLDMPEADWVGHELAGRGVVVISVDYRRAPMNGQERWGGAVRAGVHYPIPHDELEFAWAWVREHAATLGVDPDRVAIGGASAGANLAAGATVAMLHDGARRAAVGALPWQVLLAYPTLHAIQPPVPADLAQALAEAGLSEQFAPDVVRGFYENYLGAAGPAERAPLKAVPGTAGPGQLAGFPPTVIDAAELDELRVSAAAFSHTLGRARADVVLTTESGATHGYLNRPDEEPAAARTIARFAQRLTHPL